MQLNYRRKGGKTIIVGGSGFIGSRLALSLIRDGIDVTILDIVPPPRDLLRHCRYIPGDIGIRKDLRNRFCGYNSVLLFAAQLARGCNHNPAAGWATNVVGVSNVLDALAKESPTARVIFTSTGGIYRPQPPYPIAETAPIRGKNLYTSSKLAGEGMVTAWAQAMSATAVILRFFTVYGPGPASGARGHFIASWIEKIQASLPLTVHGNGRQTVDLTHISDAVSACRLAACKPIAAGQSEFYNIGSGTETAVIEVAKLFQAALPSVSILLQPEMGNYGPKRQIGDIRLARQNIGYIPTIEPREGLLSLIGVSRNQ